MDEMIVSNDGVENPVGGGTAVSPEMAEALTSIEQDFERLEDMFGDLGFSSSDSSGPGLDEMNKAAVGTPFEAKVSKTSSGGAKLLELADGNFPTFTGTQETAEEIQEWFNPVINFVRDWARRIIAQITEFVRRYSRRLAGCIPKVSAAIREFSRRKYGSALSAAWGALSCIRKALYD